MPLKKLTKAQKKKLALKTKTNQMRNEKLNNITALGGIDEQKFEVRSVADMDALEDAVEARGIKFQKTEDYIEKGQTYPPTKTIKELYPEDNFPVGEILDHPLERNANRKTSKAHITLEEDHKEILRDLREGSEIHRQVRNYMQRKIKPGMRMIDICQLLEAKNRELIGIDENDYIRRGIGFPTGVSLNNVAAHYTPNSNDNTVLKKDDVVKIDFGTQINGRIIDCAFTSTFVDKYDEFIQRIEEATNTGIREMGIDVRLGDIGAAISEVMNAEVEIDGKLTTMKPIRNLNGHNIGKWLIHAGKTVPLYDNGDQTKMEEGELFAIETFGSTGNGMIKDSVTLEDSHFMKNPKAEFVAFDRKVTRELLNHINKHYGTLAFCRRWIDDAGISRHGFSLKKLIDEGVIEAYPALEDKKGCITGQYEHTIYLRPTCKEVVSRGVDF